MLGQSVAVGYLVTAFLLAGFALLFYDASAPEDGESVHLLGIVRESDDRGRKVSLARAGSFFLFAGAAYAVARAVTAYAC